MNKITLAMAATVAFAFVGTASAHGAHAHTGAPHLVEHLVLLAVPAIIVGSMVLFGYRSNRTAVRRNNR